MTASTTSRAGDEALRLVAVRGLAQAAAAGSLQAVEALGRHLADPGGEVRWAAAAALGEARGSAGRRAMVLLEAAAAQGDPQLAAGIAAAAGGLGSVAPKRAATLLDRLAQREPVVRRAAALALRRLPRHSGARLARRLRGDPEPQVRAVVAPALARWARLDDRARQRPSGGAALRELVALCRDEAAEVRGAGAEALAALGAIAPADVVAALSADRAAVVRAAVAAGLGSADGEHTDVLLRLAADPVAGVRAAAVRSLGARGRQDALRQACSDRDPRVRAAAAAGLAVTCEDDAQLALRLCQDRDVEVARAAARVLCRHALRLGAPAWTRVLELAVDESTVAAAAEGLAQAFDQDPAQAVAVLSWWPAPESLPRFLWMVAGAARTPAVAELARCGARAVEGGEASAVALRDLAVGLHGAGLSGHARLALWLAECAEASSVEAMARAARAAGPAGRAQWVLRLAGAAQAVKRALQARTAGQRERHLAQARARLQAAREGDPRCVSYLLVRPVVESWTALLGRDHEGVTPARVEFQVLSPHLIAGPAAWLLVGIHNTGRALAGEIRVQARGGPTAHLAALAPGASAQLALPLGPLQAGRVELQGRLSYLDGRKRQAKRWRARLEVVAPAHITELANPYVVGKPLASHSSMFFGREAELAFAERALRSGERGAVVVLVGARRIGKTSLLRQLERRLASWSRPVFLDVQGLLVSGTAAFFRELAERSLGEEDVVPMLADGDVGETAGAELVREVAAQVGQPVVWLLDEFDDLDEKVRAGVLDSSVFSQLRHLMQHVEGVNLVLCGTHRLEELAGDRWSFLLNLAAHRRIGCLTPEAAARLLREPLGRLGVLCEEAAVQRALALTGRHPYFLQLLGYRLVEHCVASGDGAVRVTGVEAAAEVVVEQGEIHLRYLWQTAGAQGQPVVRALAAEEGGLTREQLRQAAGLEPGPLARALRSLAALDLVEEREQRFHLQPELLARWLRQR